MSTGRATTFRHKILEIREKPYLLRVGKLNGEMRIVAAIRKNVGYSFSARFWDCALMDRPLQLDTTFYVWEVVMTMGRDGPLPDPQEFRLIHVRSLTSTLHSTFV